ncbi:MAG: radical SAM family heme chaperone HemW [Clostridia bacterium]|nr:radical SAM family heme chaperone HemW [Clostridia bacterium]
MMTTDGRGLYVHIPFCLRKCNYCDFCSFNLSDVDWRGKYIDALCAEIDSYKDRNIAIDTIFFGGGTPSLLTPEEFERIWGVIKESFVILPGAEFTVEANPKTLDGEKLSVYKSCGVNRLSIGLQSIHENELKILGRIHNFDEFLDSYSLARECAIDNINIDLMYGIPEQTMDSFRETLHQVLALKPEHISLYGLILEEGTPLFNKKEEIAFPTEDTECDMYYLAARELASEGYSHYEISNYARADRECRHNLKYWRCEEYIGVGLNAHSFLSGRRFSNTDDIASYLSDRSASVIVEDSADFDRESEFIMLALRLSEGLCFEDYRRLFGKDFLREREKQLKLLADGDLVNLTSNGLSLTEKGFYVSNSIICELI